MRKRYFSKVNLKEKKVDVDVIKDNQKKFVANKNCFSLYANTYMPVNQIFTVDGRTFFQCINGQLLELKNGNTVNKGEFFNLFNIFSLQNVVTSLEVFMKFILSAAYLL